MFFSGLKLAMVTQLNRMSLSSRSLNAPIIGLTYAINWTFYCIADYEHAKEDNKYNWRKCRILQVGINEVISLETNHSLILAQIFICSFRWNYESCHGHVFHGETKDKASFQGNLSPVILNVIYLRVYPWVTGNNSTLLPEI